MESFNYNIEKINVSDKEGFKFILNRVKPYLKSLIVILFIIFINTVASLLNPYLIKYAIDENITKNNIEGLWITSGFLLAVIIIDSFTRYLQIKWLGDFGQKMLFGIRKDLFEKLQTLPQRFFSENKSGDIISRLTNNVEAINNMFSEGIIRIIGTIFSMIGTAVIIVLLNWKMSLIAFIPLILMIIFLYIQGRFLAKRIKEALDQDAQVVNHIQESINGFQIIKGFGQENWAIDEFTSRNEKYFQFALKSGFINSLGAPVLLFLSALGTIIVVIFSVNLLKNGEITIGTILAFLIYLRQFYQPMTFIAALWKNIQTGIASAQRIAAVLKLKSEIEEKQNPYIPDKNFKGNIIFKDVSFSYDGINEVLNEITFEINHGETVAIIGPTGGGKTTFVKLIARLYDVTKGEILLNNVNLKDWKISELRKRIGYLLQDSIIFDDTVFNNLKYSNENITKEEILLLFQSMGLDSFITKLPEGLDTMLENGGKNISAGERQILSIARILLRKPAILILDEATSNIDTKTEILVQKAIEFATKNITSIVIAHRLSTIKSADRIVLIQDNKILESGTRLELINNKGAYYNMINQ